MKSNCSNKQQTTASNNLWTESISGVMGDVTGSLWAAFETLSGTALHCIKSGTTKSAANDTTITTVMGSVTKMGILAETEMYCVFKGTAIENNKRYDNDNTAWANQLKSYHGKQYIVQGSIMKRAGQI